MSESVKYTTYILRPGQLTGEEVMKTEVDNLCSSLRRFRSFTPLVVQRLSSQDMKGLRRCLAQNPGDTCCEGAGGCFSTRLCGELYGRGKDVQVIITRDHTVIVNNPDAMEYAKRIAFVAQEEGFGDFVIVQDYKK